MKFLSFVLLAACVVSAQVAPPSDPGMYVQSNNGYGKIIGQIAQFTRTGSRFVSTAMVGIKSAKANIQLQGAHAQSTVSPQPTFYFIPPKQAAEAGVNAGDLILIRLEEKPQRRQFEIAAAGLFRASAGISLTHQIQLLRSEPKPGVYVITPATELRRGEYALYLARGEGMAAYVYDFGVQGTTSSPAVLQNNRERSASTLSEITSPRIVGGSSSTSDGGAPSAQLVTAIPTMAHGGSLGIFGTDWQQEGAKGIEIVKVLEDSSAALAGLQKGDVITDVNGVRIGSSQELSNILSGMEAGSRVSIAYLYKSNIGWMPKSAVVILSRE